MITPSTTANAQDVTATDWIEHDGAGCPVSDLARVQVWFRFDRDQRAAERQNQPDGVPAHGYSSCWTHQDAPSDIIAYRVVA
jgi:hypothetical protein